MINLIWVKDKVIVFLLTLIIFLPPTLLVGGYTFYSLTLIETLVLVTCLLWSLGKMKIPKVKINLPILFYLLSCLLSMINSYYLRGSWEEIIKLVCCIFLFLIIGNYFFTHIKLFTHTFIFTTLILVLLSLSYFFSNLPESLNTRLYYPLGNPNLLAGFLVIVIPLLWSHILNIKSTNKFYTHGLSLLLLFSLITLYFSHSKGGILGVFGAMLFLSFINWKNASQSKRYGLILVPCLLVAMGLLIIYKSIFFSQQGKLPIDIQRLYIWKYSLQMFLDHPILGVGPGAYPNVYLDYMENKQWHLHSHNIFIQHAAEVGVVGLLSFIWLLITLFKANYNKASGTTYEKIVREGLLASLIGFLIHNQVDYLFWIPVFQLYFWLIVGILTSLQVKEYVYLPVTFCGFICVVIILFWSFCTFKPFLGYISFNQGVELADKGKWEEAKSKFEKAILFDFHPIYHVHLGKTYIKIHPPDISSAMREYEKARELDNSNAWRKISHPQAKKKDTLYWKLYRRMPMSEL